MLKKLIASLLALVCVIPNAYAITPVKMERIPTVFGELIKNKKLGNPAMVLIDLNSGQTVFSKDADGARKPASTLKLISAMAILDYLPVEKTFSTTLFETDLKNKKPWIFND